MSGLEIERKFLVRNDDYKRQAYSSSRICQGYICSGHGRTVRVRIRDQRGYLTIKGPSNHDGISRYEFEKEITLDEAQHLMQLCEPGRIDKTRYLVKSGDHIFEVACDGRGGTPIRGRILRKTRFHRKRGDWRPSIL